MRSRWSRRRVDGAAGGEVDDFQGVEDLEQIARKRAGLAFEQKQRTPGVSTRLLRWY